MTTLDTEATNGKPLERPKNNPELIKLPAAEYNQCLRDTLAYFNGKQVKLPDGTIGVVIGVDPRPMRNGNPTATGQDGNFLIIRIERKGVLPGRSPHANAYAMPDDLEVLDAPAAAATPSPKEQEIKT